MLNPHTVIGLDIKNDRSIILSGKKNSYYIFTDFKFLKAFPWFLQISPVVGMPSPSSSEINDNVKI